MSLANEYLTQARGWNEFEIADTSKPNQEHLDFSHKVAKIFSSSEGKEVLIALVQRYLIGSFTNDNEPNSLLRKQGRADVIKQILAQIEISNNTK